MKKVEKVQELQRNVEELKNSVVELQRRLWIYENPNIPSSKRILKEKKDDENRPEGKKGAPEGHVGATRDKPKPNRFIDLKPRVCAGCNSRNIEMTGKEKKIIEDIRIEKVVTEFTQYRYHCNDCGCDHVTTHPELPKTGIFGPTITGIWEMLHYKGHVPFECLSQISGNLFGVPITQGGMHNAIYRTAQIFEPTFEEIRQQIRESNYVRSDETFVSLQRPQLVAVEPVESRHVPGPLEGQQGNRSIEGSVRWGLLRYIQYRLLFRHMTVSVRNHRSAGRTFSGSRTKRPKRMHTAREFVRC